MKKQLALASAILGLAVSFGAPVVSNAAYQLNEEVKDPTPALKEALQLVFVHTILKLYKTCQTKMLWLL